MAKISRATGNIKAFASAAAGLERTVFGDITQADDLASNMTPEFLLGWAGVGAGTTEPSLQDFNALGFTLSQYISYLHQAGVPEHDVAQEYFIGNITSKNGKLFNADNDNTNSPPPSIDWTEIGDITPHLAASDPHPQYLTPAEGDAAYDPLGGLAQHAGAVDPHPQYLTPAEGDAAYKPINAISVPTGAVIAMSDNGVPSGFLTCNGAAISRSSYAVLFAYIGTLYGVGNGSTTFNLPDLRGEFIRGWDDARGVDVGRVIGSTQGDEIRSHRHMLASDISGSSNLKTVTDTSGSDEGFNGTAYTQFEGGAETRPRNIAMLYCIKY